MTVVYVLYIMNNTNNIVLGWRPMNCRLNKYVNNAKHMNTICTTNLIVFLVVFLLYSSFKPYVKLMKAIVIIVIRNVRYDGRLGLYLVKYLLPCRSMLQSSWVYSGLLIYLTSTHTM